MGRIVRGISLSGAVLAFLATSFGDAHDATADDASEHPLVRIHQNRLQPEVIHLDSGDPLGWINSTSQVARVSFDADTAGRITCEHGHGLRATGRKLESPPIQALPFTSRCHLEPGQYRYRVELGAGLGAGGSGAPLRWLEGRVVVE